jgi:poly-gamma-glutamate synthase PgsB/CapB
MARAFFVVLALVILLLIPLILEWRRHLRARSRIPVRIFVNGTRGKSSVTRLVAAALREHGIPTVAKTTGTASRLILPDGEDEIVHRHGPPNIRELMRTMSRARRMGAEAVVFECMAVTPELQRVAESRIMQSTITVITNARLDHTDVQGSSPEAIAASFAVRPGGLMISADPTVIRVLGPIVEMSGGRVHLASQEGFDERDLAAMSYLEHRENVALAVAVAELAGVPRAVALNGVRKARPDPGAASVLTFNGRTEPWVLVNLFAANDPESTFRALDRFRPLLPPRTKPIVLLSSRGERVSRSAEFVVALARERDAFSQLIVWGKRTSAVCWSARRKGIPEQSIVNAGSIPPADLTDLLLERMNGHRVVVGMGNFVGPPQEWLSELAEEGKERHPEPML